MASNRNAELIPPAPMPRVCGGAACAALRVRVSTGVRVCECVGVWSCRGVRVCKCLREVQ